MGQIKKLSCKMNGSDGPIFFNASCLKSFIKIKIVMINTLIAYK